MGRLSLDTTVLIDLQKERRKGSLGRAHDFLNKHLEDSLFVSCVAWGEFLEGFADVEDERVARLEESITILAHSAATAKIYATLARNLKREGWLIGANDLWIASSCMEHSLPLVSRNTEHFGRIPGLRIVD